MEDNSPGHTPSSVQPVSDTVPASLRSRLQGPYTAHIAAINTCSKLTWRHPQNKLKSRLKTPKHFQINKICLKKKKIKP